MRFDWKAATKEWLDRLGATVREEPLRVLDSALDFVGYQAGVFAARTAA